MTYQLYSTRLSTNILEKTGDEPSGTVSVKAEYMPGM